MYPASKEGSAVIIALIISIIAIGLSVFAVRMSHNINKTSQMLIDKLYAKIESDSEVERLKFFFSTGVFYENYAKNTIKNMPNKIYLDGRKWKIDNSTISIQDAGGLLDILYAPSNLIANLLKIEDNISTSNINTVSGSIMDWIDRDDMKRINGAESFYYKTHGFNYTPRNFNGLQSIYELRLIRGLNDNKTFRKIQDYLILSPKWMLNINTMDSNMLAACLNIPIKVANDILLLRKQKGFLTLDDIYKITGKKYYGIYSSLSTHATCTVRIYVASKYKNAIQKIKCVIYFNPNKKQPFTILKWVDID